jgi:hypothetical protein
MQERVQPASEEKEQQGVPRCPFRRLCKRERVRICMRREALERPRRWNQKRTRRAKSESSSESSSVSRGRASEVSVSLEGSEQISLAGRSPVRARAKAKMAAPSRQGRGEWDVHEGYQARRDRIDVTESAASVAELQDLYMTRWIEDERIAGDDDLNNDWKLVASRSRNHQRSRSKRGRRWRQPGS